MSYNISCLHVKVRDPQTSQVACYKCGASWDVVDKDRENRDRKFQQDHAEASYERAMKGIK